MGNLLYAIPVPKMEPSALSDPEWFIDQVTTWTERLAWVGIELTPEQLQHGARGVAWRYREGVIAAREPVGPFFRSIKANQQWGLFGAVTEVPDRLVIEADRGEGYQRVFAKLDPVHAWREPVWRYRRVRGIWDSVKKGKKPRGTYRRLAMWTARELFLEDPSIERVQFKLESFRLADPWEELDEEITVRGDISHQRDRFRFFSMLVPPVEGSPQAKERDDAQNGDQPDDQAEDGSEDDDAAETEAQ